MAFNRQEVINKLMRLKTTEINKCINAYIDLLKQNIMKQPALWLWSHRRWKDKHQYI